MTGFFVLFANGQVFQEYGTFYGCRSRVNRGIAFTTQLPELGHTFTTRSGAQRVAKRFLEWGAKVIPADHARVTAGILARHEAEKAAA